jgi:hypothetical protein
MNLIIKRASDGESITLGDAFKDFVESRNLKDKTIHDYGLSMIRHLALVRMILERDIQDVKIM